MVKNHSNKDDMIKVTRASEYSHQSLNLLKFIIEKYVLNMETLQYDSTNTSSDAIKNKITIIKNLSRKDVYNNYIKNSYNSENGDISLAILKLKKIATIEKIEFIYDNLNIIEKFYSQLACPTTPKGAKVYFSSETTSEKNKKQYFVATLFFSFYIASQKKVNSTVEFKVNDYSVKMINKDDYSFNE